MSSSAASSTPAGPRSPSAGSPRPGSPNGSRSASGRRRRRCGRCPTDEAFDIAFIDADKTGYEDYFEECLARLRPGGLILLDNVLLSGRVLDPPSGDESAAALAALNQRLAGDERVDLAMVGIADGLTIARKR